MKIILCEFFVVDFRTTVIFINGWSEGTRRMLSVTFLELLAHTVALLRGGKKVNKELKEIQKNEGCLIDTFSQQQPLSSGTPTGRPHQSK